MTELRLTTTATSQELTAAGAIIASRDLGPLGRLVAAFGVVGGALAGGAAMSIVGGVELSDALLVSTWAAIGGGVAFFVVRMALGRRFQRRAAGSSLLGRPREMILDATGVTLCERRIAWNGFVGVQRSKTATYLMSSQVDAIVVPDRDLPQGMSPAAFASLIEGWTKPR